MAAIEVGRLCVKLAGRDAGKECVIVDTLDKSFVLIDGNTRRKKANVAHLELLPQKADIKKGASHEEVVKALQELGITVEAKAPPKARKEAATEKKEAKTEGKPKKTKTEK